jgi:predicted outer membrane repeat protein
MHQRPENTATRRIDQATFELLEPRLLLSAAAALDTSDSITDPLAETVLLAAATIDSDSLVESLDDAAASDITVSDGILSVSPGSASPGDANVLVTFTLDAGIIPPLPPSHVSPNGAWIGDIAGTSITRNGSQVSAYFTIPVDRAAGLEDVSVSFPMPGDTLIYTKSAAFEIIGVQTPDVFYVDVNNTSGSWDGESWGTAFQTIGEALDAAEAAGASEVWIADGVYKPTAGTDRQAGFELVDGIGLYGGFEGVDEVERSDRDPDTYVTVLSGDIGAPGDASDNSFHVVFGADRAVLDGVTVTGGNANGELIDSAGGGMLNYDGAAVTVVDCLFTGNHANEGGGMFNFNSSIATVVDSEFVSNTANRGGAMVNRVDAHAEVSGTLFDSNQAAWRGGAVFNDYGSSPTFTDCTFTSNHTGGHGGAIYTDDASSATGFSSPVISGSTFTGNSADYRGGAIANYNHSTPEISSSTFTGNTAGTGGGAIANDYYVTAVISDSTFTGNEGGAGLDDVDSDASSTVQYESASAFEGYTLFAPLGSMTTYLMDNDGQFVHSWDSSHRPGLSAYLLETGNLLRTGNLGANPTFDGGGGGGVIEEIEWDGTIAWSFEYSSADYLQHHDIEVLPNGNVLMIAWEYKTSAEAIAAGRDTSLLTDGELWPGHIIEVEPSGASGGNIVWEWRAWDHLVQDYDPAQANYGVVGDNPELIDLNYSSNGGADWLHINSIDYNEQFDQILLSVHNFNEVWVIDHSTTTAEAAGNAGDLLYRWGNPQAYDAGGSGDQVFYAQHDARWIASGLPGEGNILVFNNGFGRPEGSYSTVEEIAPPVDASGNYSLTTGSDYGPADQTWVYTAPTPTDFYSDRISGAQRLPNGNTLICSGQDGLFFEVNSDNEIVWQYDYDGGVFRAWRYSPDYQGLEGRDLTPPAAAAAPAIEVAGETVEFNAVALSYSVVDTGQTEFYNNTGTIGAPAAGSAFYGQDAQFTGNAPSYTLSVDGLTVYDNVTDLTWTQSPDFDNDGDIDADDKFSFAEAGAYVSVLNAANFGGYDDWRLPSIKEVYSLIDFSGEDPSGYDGTDTSGLVPFIDTDYFDFGYGDTSAGERIIDAQMASSTLYVGNTANDGGATMFGVNFADGRIKGYGLTLFGSDKTFYAYYVRGNTAYGENDFSNNGDGTITDAATGLMWSQDDSGAGMNWQDALAWVQQKNAENYLGHSDWRMPDVKELQSIVDYSRSPQTTNSPAIDAMFNTTSITIEDGSSDYAHFWSGTTHANWQGGGQTASYVNFGESMGYMGGWVDVHGAGAQRSDPKDGDPADYPTGRGPQGDAIRIFNFVRLVRDADVVVNQAPAADAGGPYATQTDTPVLLDGSGSSDIDGAVVSYEWDLDNDGQYDDAVGAIVSFESASVGTYSVGLLVTDDGGATDTDATLVNVTLAGWTGVMFVNGGNVSGTYDGLAWGTAWRTVQEGLDAAAAAGGGDVWVAQGLYTPTSTFDREISFELKPNVDLYGGFEGDEDSLDQRDWTAFATVLSGDIGVIDDSSDNSYHVVIGSNNALLDGFTITDGRADGLSGGGVANHQASPTIRNTVITDNTADKGAGMYNDSGSSPSIINVVFASNYAETKGGAIANDGGSSPTIINATITDNFARDQGGGLYQGGYDPDLGGLNNPILINTILWGNGIETAGPAEVSNWHFNDPAVSYSLVSADQSGVGNVNADPLFVDTEGGQFGLLAGSPAIDSADGNSAPDNDIEGSSRYDDLDTADTGSGLPAYADMGAFEYQGVVSVPVTVESVVINSGDAGRSRIVSIGLVLSDAAEVLPEALTLHNDSTGEDFPPGSVPFDSVTHTWDLSSIALTDGEYTATVAASGVIATGGAVMDADHQFEFHVLQCDTDGDGRVGDGDYGAMVAQFGRSGNDLGCDFNSDGRVNLRDFAVLRGRFGATLSVAAAAPAVALQATPAQAAPVSTAEPVESSVDLLQESPASDEREVRQADESPVGPARRTIAVRQLETEDPTATRPDHSSAKPRRLRTPHRRAHAAKTSRSLDRRFDADNRLPDLLAEAVVLMPLE